ncbi:hypothetical protein Vqi01_11740 [Micromonospora qiuiae]|uniref:N-acetyltransferase domain-containing protein n=1 Tax=Micromonospora qiuiae TaxID=502268 RepID=A0ABQ4J7B9_9ACTN|nr:hypothetical protein Vqi01_11740 [Micromonospora qiuiae]
MLAVDPAAQGRGAGAALVEACVARATELGCTALAICVRDGYAEAAHRLYRRRGFVRVPESASVMPGVRSTGGEALQRRLVLLGEAHHRGLLATDPEPLGHLA